MSITKTLDGVPLDELTNPELGLALQKLNAFCQKVRLDGVRVSDLREENLTAYISKVESMKGVFDYQGAWAEAFRTQPAPHASTRWEEAMAAILQPKMLQDRLEFMEQENLPALKGDPELIQEFYLELYEEISEALSLDNHLGREELEKLMRQSGEVNTARRAALEVTKVYLQWQIRCVDKLMELLK